MGYLYEDVSNTNNQLRAVTQQRRVDPYNEPSPFLFAAISKSCSSPENWRVCGEYKSIHISINVGPFDVARKELKKELKRVIQNIHWSFVNNLSRGSGRTCKPFWLHVARSPQERVVYRRGEGSALVAALRVTAIILFVDSNNFNQTIQVWLSFIGPFGLWIFGLDQGSRLFLDRSARAKRVNEAQRGGVEASAYL